MLLCNNPLIGILMVDPTGSIEVSYYAVSADRLPSVQTILDTLLILLGYADVKVVNGPVNHTYESKCKDPTTLQTNGG